MHEVSFIFQPHKELCEFDYQLIISILFVFFISLKFSPALIYTTPLIHFDHIISTSFKLIKYFTTNDFDRIFIKA